jgi:methylmalonyl-CoA mutase C-terminal domain/subunit
MELLKANKMEDVTVSAGGIIPDEEVVLLKAQGVAGVFGPGTPTQDIVEFIKSTVKQK